MDENYWKQRWQENDIAFHEESPNPRLPRYFDQLNVPKGGRIFVPLCGKTVDIRWLLSNGYRVAGVELSELAVSQLFSDNGLHPQVTNVGALKRYSAANIDVYVGNIFNLTAALLDPVDGIYDRGAFIALPRETRATYAEHMTDICQGAPQLLITCDYDERKIKGSPYPISSAELFTRYGNTYELKLVDSADIAGGLKGISPAITQAWVLTIGSTSNYRVNPLNSV